MRILFFVFWASWGLGNPNLLFAGDPEVEALKKIVAIQQSQIQLLKTQIEKNRSDTDARFRQLKVNVSQTLNYYQNALTDGYAPRSEYVWWDSTTSGEFTGFHCPEGLLSSGADYWKSSNHFHRTYCRKLELQDKGW